MVFFTWGQILEKSKAPIWQLTLLTTPNTLKYKHINSK